MQTFNSTEDTALHILISEYIFVSIKFYLMSIQLIKQAFLATC